MKEKKESVLAVIPARGGSKGLPQKNLALLAGKPLIAWTIEAARASRFVDRVLVTTDDAAIADVARQHGADVPFLRPASLSRDRALTEPALLHAVDWLRANEGKDYDVLLYMQATDPFRREEIVSDVVETLLLHPEFDTVFAARPEHKNFWKFQDGQFVPLDNRGHLPRQVKEPVYREDTGIACASRMHVIRSGRRIGDRVMILPHTSPGDFIDIHTELDLYLANVLAFEKGEFPNGTAAPNRIGLDFKGTPFLA